MSLLPYKKSQSRCKHQGGALILVGQADSDCSNGLIMRCSRRDLTKLLFITYPALLETMDSSFASSRLFLIASVSTLKPTGATVLPEEKPFSSRQTSERPFSIFSAAAAF